MFSTYAFNYFSKKKNRFKPDPLINPHGMSEHDSRPKEALEREQKMNYKKEEEEIKKIDEY